MPRDQHGSWQRIQRDHRIRVGVIERPPWAVRGTGQPGGVEPELLRRFAVSYGLTPEWYWGGEQAHMEALERYELDVVIGGLESDTPWAKTQKIGITKPFFRIRERLEDLQWVESASVRLREDGDVLSGEIFLQPRDERDLMRRLEQAKRLAEGMDWRLHDISIVPVRKAA